MQSLINSLENYGRRGTGAIVAFRVLTAALVVLAMGVVGSALFEYRTLQAVAHLPAVRYEEVLSTECPEGAANVTTEAVAGSVTDRGDDWGLASLAGFRCTIPLSPD